MLDLNAKDRVEEIVSSKMYNNTSFTSLDIANEAKAEGLWARNRDVANWLRSNAIRVAFSQGSLYNQTLIRVDSKDAGMTLAYLYHHMNKDADDYLDRDQNPQSCRRVPTTPALQAASTIGLINQSIQKLTASTTIIPDSFASRDAARTWVRNNSGYAVVDHGPYDVNRWRVKPR